MWDFSLFRAFGLILRTLPFIVVRMLVYFGMAFAYLFFTGIGAGVGYSIGAFGTDEFRSGATAIGGLAGFGMTAAVLYLLREYILYVVKAGHIAVLVQLLDGKPLPEGKGQFSYASEIVKARFTETSVLFLLDQLIRGVIATITGLVRGITSILPIPGLNALMNFLHAFLKIAAGFIDEVILAYLIRTHSRNPWESARIALVLYGQNYKPMLRNAAFLTIFIYLLSIVIFLLILGPAATLVYTLPGMWSGAGFVFALIFVWAFKKAVLEPIAIACMMQAYFKTIEGQTPDPEWDARLASISKKFQTIKDKALAAI
jgi:hypothetical protein